MFSFIKDIIAPKKCYSCKKEWHFLCLECLSNMSNFDSICYVCKRKTDNFEIHKNCRIWVHYDKMIILTHYKNKYISKLIKNFKFYWKKDILWDFSLYLWQKLWENIDRTNKNNFLIVPVPMKFLKKLKRWYNPPEIIAKNIARQLDIEYKSSLLKKVKNTRQQSILSRQERLTNLDKAFKINKKYVDNIDKKYIIIVDDVISTGTTINEVSKILKQHNAQKIIWLCIASD